MVLFCEKHILSHILRFGRIVNMCNWFIWCYNKYRILSLVRTACTAPVAARTADIGHKVHVTYWNVATCQNYNIILASIEILNILLGLPHTGHRPQPQNAATGIFPLIFIHFIWTRRTRLSPVAATRYKTSQLASRSSKRPLNADTKRRHPRLARFRAPLSLTSVKPVGVNGNART